MPNILRLESKPQLEVFDFDETAAGLYRDTLAAYTRAYVNIAELMTEEEKLAKIHDRLVVDLKYIFSGMADFRLRVALAERVPEHSFVRLWSHVDFDGDAGKWLEVPLEGSMIGRCMKAKNGADLLDLDRAEHRELFGNADVDKRVVARTSKDVRWTLALRLPDLGTQNGRSIALAVDCNYPLSAADPERARELLMADSAFEDSLVAKMTEIAQSVRKPDARRRLHLGDSHLM